VSPKVLLGFQILLLVLTIAAAFRQKQVRGKWWWPIVAIFITVAFFGLGSILIALVLNVVLGERVNSDSGSMQFLSSLILLALASEFGLVVLNGFMAFIPRRYVERPKYYIWWAIGITFVAALGLVIAGSFNCCSL
jgi:ABC-type glycerol-3-phosphate transport system permease component